MPTFLAGVIRFCRLADFRSFQPLNFFCQLFLVVKDVFTSPCFFSPTSNPFIPFRGQRPNVWLRPSPSLAPLSLESRTSTSAPSLPHVFFPPPPLPLFQRLLFSFPPRGFDLAPLLLKRSLLLALRPSFCSYSFVLDFVDEKVSSSPTLLARPPLFFDVLFSWCFSLLSPSPASK